MTMKLRLTLTQRLSLVFAVLLLVCSGTSAWMQLRASRMHELEVVQGLSRDVDADGRIAGHAAPDGRVRRERVDLAPVHRLLDGGTLPILGDDPRSADGRKVFSAAPLRVNGKDVGFIYVVLQGEAHDQLVAQGSASTVLNTALWSIGMVALLCLVAGLVAFALITRPLRRLTEEVAGFDIHGAPPRLPPAAPEEGQDSRDEIAVLRRAYRQMVARMGEQWQALTRQDQERRELIANVSHDLRTPLSSLHGYLETLLLKDAVLDAAERRRYLGIAIDQSRKVGELAQSLFELARLEYGFVQPEPEPFSMVDLVQDLFQKFELRAQARQVALQADFPPRLPAVHADLGMTERVLGNLLDNALRHTPEGGAVRITLAPGPTPRGPQAQDALGVQVTVSDTGPGIAMELRDGLFQRPFTVGGARRGGGLGLRIVHRMLELQGSRIELVDLAGQGAVFRFVLPSASRPA
jgi:signal transduction histidine kinase